MPKIDSRLLDMTDPVAAENFNRTLKEAGTMIESVVLTSDATGKITGGTLTMKDKTTVPITVSASE